MRPNEKISSILYIHEYDNVTFVQGTQPARTVFSRSVMKITAKLGAFLVPMAVPWVEESVEDSVAHLIQNDYGLVMHNGQMTQ